MKNHTTIASIGYFEFVLFFVLYSLIESVASWQRESIIIFLLIV